MKKSFFGIITLLFAVWFCSCTNGGNPDEVQKKGSSGKTLELLVVADNDIYTGDTKELIDSIFASPQLGLPEMESKFDIVNIPLSSFESTEMFKVHRNIILLDVSPDNPDKVYMHLDEYAAPQVIVDFACKDFNSLQANIRKYQDFMFHEFYNAEHRRVQKAFEGMKGYDVNEAIKKKFAFGLMFSNEFALVKEAQDFAWVRKEAKDFGIGVLIDVFPYEAKQDFDENHILDRLDSTMKRYVPASAENSYMGIERRRDEAGNYLAPIYSKVVNFDSSDYAVETRGRWRAFGDFMGGPFVTYTILSPDKKRVVMLTGYVYCPRNKPWTKRDLLMQVESICWSLQW